MIFQYAINTKKIVSLTQVSDLLNIISEERREKINRLYFLKDKLHSLFVEIILRYALWEQYSINSPYIEFKQSEYGKPSFVHYRDIHFNLSHSGDWVICGIGDTPLGIDVEQIKEMKSLFANRIYTEEESAFIDTSPLEDRPKAFYKIWTLKESYVKNVGMGLGIPFNSLSFRFYDDDIQFYLEGKRNCSFSFKTGQLDDQHITALCVNSKWNNMINNHIKILTLEQLWQWRNL